MLAWGLLCVAIALVALVLFTFNDLVGERNQVRAAWADIDVQLQRRHDLVPALAAAVKGYADHERATLTAVTELRSAAQAGGSIAQRAQVEAQLGAQLGRLIAIQENYPELKASENFLKLQKDLVDIEDHLQYARRFYNGAVRLFNTHIENFPALLVARPFGFREQEFFQADLADKVTP